MTGELILAIIGGLGVGELLHFIVSKIFSKKQDTITTQKDEFAAIRERLTYNEKETNRLNKAQVIANRKISRLYTCLAEVTTKTCAKTDCPIREILAINFDDLDYDAEETLINDSENDNE